jgi:hypothetical protein
VGFARRRTRIHAEPWLRRGLAWNCGPILKSPPAPPGPLLFLSDEERASRARVAGLGQRRPTRSCRMPRRCGRACCSASASLPRRGRRRHAHRRAGGENRSCRGFALANGAVARIADRPPVGVGGSGGFRRASETGSGKNSDDPVAYCMAGARSSPPELPPPPFTAPAFPPSGPGAEVLRQRARLREARGQARRGREDYDRHRGAAGQVPRSGPAHAPLQ